MPGINADDQIAVQLDNIPVSGLVRSGNTFNGTVAVYAAQDAEHEISVIITNSTGDSVSEKRTTFSIANTANIPLEIIKQEPENNDKDVEPNAFVAFYFNRPIDSTLMQIEVLETVHGKAYASAGTSSDITSLSDVTLIDIHRDKPFQAVFRISRKIP